MGKISMICSSSRVDRYDDGQFYGSYPYPFGTIPSPNSLTGQQFEVFFADPARITDLEDSMGTVSYEAITGPALIETEDSIVFLNSNHQHESVSLRVLFSDFLEELSREVCVRQVQDGYFPSTPQQIESLKNYLYALTRELSFFPKCISVPIFAWFNYAPVDDSSFEETDIPDHVELPSAFLSSLIPCISQRFTEMTISIDGIKSFFIKNVFIRKALFDSISL